MSRRKKDERTGRYVYVLNLPKKVESLNETEGILAELNERLKAEGIDTPDLVKRVWKR